MPDLNLVFSVDLQSGSGVGGDAEGDTYTNIENVLGSGYADTLSGDTAANALSGGAGDDLLAGGTGDDTLTGDAGADAFLFATGDGQDVITDFEVGVDSLIINGVTVDPHNLPDGVVVTQQLSGTGGFDLLVSYGTGDSILLSGIDMDEWRPVVVTIAGTDQDDVITGTQEADIIASGAGSDTITAWNGDDTIIYDSDNDWISGGAGADTLDLSKYSSDQVSFRIVGHDVFIDTPDGSIELNYQVRYDVGHDRSNIETLLFSDGSLDEAGIRSRTVSDQVSNGNDVVAGLSDPTLRAAGITLLY